MLKFFKHFCLGLLMTLAAPVFAAGVLENCTSCHVPDKMLASTFDRHPIGTSSADRQCYACHIQLIRGDAIKGFPQFLRSSLGPRMQKKQTYAQAKALVFKLPQGAQSNLLKYNEEGFFRYLRSPIPRHHFQNPSSMYPISTALEQKLRRELQGSLQKTQPLIADPRRMQRGEELFTKNCLGCHGGNGPGPSLRLGLPLLSEKYIMAVLQGEIPEILSRMPRFPELGREDKEAMAHYLQFADADRKSPSAPAEASDVLLPQEIYPKVIVPMLGSSCRHCHAESAAKQTDFQTLFGYDRPIRFFMHKTERGYEPTSEGMAMLIPKAGSCEPSEFLQRLSARRKEAQGERVDKPGMPLTMPPVSSAALDSIRSWQRSGCLVDGKRLCQPCDKLTVQK